MSQVYSTEPQTTGRVVVQTTQGPIDIHLWCHECPTTTRTFLQLCLDGYFDDMIFHRILPDFLIQTGFTRKNDRGATSIPSDEEMEQYMKRITSTASTASSTLDPPRGASIDRNTSLRRKRLELNARIKFNHRGQVALALPLVDTPDGIEDESSSLSILMRQFFITLSEASFLHLKHVIFGTVSGPTIFNALRIGKAEAKEDTGLPLDTEHAPRITGVKIDFHPFADLVVTPPDHIPWKKVKSIDPTDESDLQKRRKKRQGKRDIHVLSFGDDMEVGEDHPSTSGMKSLHDAVMDTAAKVPLVKNVHNVLKQPLQAQAMGKDASAIPMEELPPNRNIVVPLDRPESNQRTSMDDAFKESELPSVRFTATNSSTQRQERVLESSKNKTEDNDNSNPTATLAKDTGSMSIVEARRAKYLSQRKTLTQGSVNRDEDTLNKLMAFKRKISMVKSGQETSEGKRVNTDSITRSASALDDSLAARMAKKLAREERGAIESKVKHFSTPAYAGQVLDTDQNDDDSSAWIKTTFQCKRHIDAETAEDGKRNEDYEVIDSRKSNSKQGHESRNHRNDSHNHLKHHRHKHHS